MKSSWPVLLFEIICFSSRLYSEPVATKTIPSNLLLGVATSSYQIEGAWNEDGKTENIWDRLTHTRPNKIDDQSTGDIACDSYHKIKEDVTLIKDMGFQFYRFSLSWSRILPSGFPNKINQAGIKHYNELIDQLLANNIIPMVTIFHWDLPQSLQDLGGWANPEIVKWFKNFAGVVFEHFADRVPMWITINEPKQICQYGYGFGMFAPGLESDGIGDYICGHNVLKAHAEVYHLYDDVYRLKYQGRIGITNQCGWGEPATTDREDFVAAERRKQFDFGVYINPVFHKDGDYPQIVKELIAKRSKEEGFLRSRLPEFTPQEVEFIKGTSDFFGLNHYSTLYVRNREPDPIGIPSNWKDMNVDIFQDDKWLTGSLDYFRLVPWGFSNVLNYIKDMYGNPEIIVTENGFPDLGGFNDGNRIKYFTGTIGAMLDAIHDNNVRVIGYTAWSLIDNFEWSAGYTIKFGLYHVNFSNPNRPRTPKDSAKFFREIIRTRELPIN